MDVRVNDGCTCELPHGNTEWKALLKIYSLGSRTRRVSTVLRGGAAVVSAVGRHQLGVNLFWAVHTRLPESQLLQ